MAYLVKNSNTIRTAGVAGTGQALLAQNIHVQRGAATLPATTTEMLFRVFGGRILVHLLYVEVTTAIQAQATNYKISSKALSAASVAVGTAVDLFANVDINALEIGGNLTALGSGAAAIKNNAGAGIATLGRMDFVCPQGEIYATTGATSTGAVKVDLLYQPLDEGAYVVAQAAATAII